MIKYKVQELWLNYKYIVILLQFMLDLLQLESGDTLPPAKLVVESCFSPTGKLLPPPAGNQILTFSNHPHAYGIARWPATNNKSFKLADGFRMRCPCHYHLNPYVASLLLSPSHFTPYTPHNVRLIQNISCRQYNLIARKTVQTDWIEKRNLCSQTSW